MARVEKVDPILFSMGATIVLKSVDALRLKKVRREFQDYMDSQEIYFRIVDGQSDRVVYELKPEDAVTALRWLKEHRKRLFWKPVEHFNI